jgi:Mn2+/Fe2+ NRAMP family transporter
MRHLRLIVLCAIACILLGIVYLRDQTSFKREFDGFIIMIGILWLVTITAALAYRSIWPKRVSPVSKVNIDSTRND